MDIVTTANAEVPKNLYSLEWPAEGDSKKKSASVEVYGKITHNFSLDL